MPRRGSRKRSPRASKRQASVRGDRSTKSSSPAKCSSSSEANGERHALTGRSEGDSVASRTRSRKRQHRASDTHDQRAAQSDCVSSQNSLAASSRASADGARRDKKTTAKRKATGNRKKQDAVKNEGATIIPTSGHGLFWCVVIGILTVGACLHLSLDPEGKLAGTLLATDLARVWSYGWVTAASTGLGAMPLALMGGSQNRWRAVANAAAAGMMCAASLVLLREADQSEHSQDKWMQMSCLERIIIGFLSGIEFIFLTKKWLGDDDELSFASLNGADARKALLVVSVMFLHSFAEGVGIGVAFGGDHSNKLGKFISLSLAIHNVPEGLAVGATLTPRGVGFFSTVALAVLSSIPQPIVAVFVYCFMSAAAPLLPLGFGFAAGAMIYVAICELIPEALELGFPRLHCAAIVGGAATLMLVMQSSLG